MSLLETKGGDNYFWQRDYGAGDDGDRCRLFTIDPISGTIHTWISEAQRAIFHRPSKFAPGRQHFRHPQKRLPSQLSNFTIQHTASTLHSEVLENAKSCLTWDGKSANGGAKSGEMYCTFSRHGHAIQLKPASAQLGFIFNFVFPSIFCPSRPSTQTAQMPNWCKMQNYNGVDKRFNGTVGASLLAGVKGHIAKSKLSLQTNKSPQRDIFPKNTLTR